MKQPKNEFTELVEYINLKKDIWVNYFADLYIKTPEERIFKKLEIVTN